MLESKLGADETPSENVLTLVPLLGSTSLTALLGSHIRNRLPEQPDVTKAEAFYAA